MEKKVSKNAFCTIVQASYFSYALALYDSICTFDKHIPFYIFVTDGNIDFTDVLKSNPNIKVLLPESVCKSDFGKILYDKYIHTNMDSFRQSMKTPLVRYILEKEDYDKVIYLDADLYFFNDFYFLFDELDNCGIFLIPHWRATNPNIDPVNFQTLLTDGIYNGGIIGGRKMGVEAMNWLSNALAYKCIIEPTKGFFGDQTYLTLLPFLFDYVKIIKHQGCNVANWNMVECERNPQSDGTVLINNKYPIIFIHFTRSTIEGILSGDDKYLLKYLELYRNAIMHRKPNFDIIAKYTPIQEENSSVVIPIYSQTNYFRRIKRKIRSILKIF